jgi:putative membrane protein
LKLAHQSNAENILINLHSGLFERNFKKKRTATEANMMNGQGWAGMGAGMSIGMIGMAIFCLLIIVAIVVLLGRLLGVGGKNEKKPQKTALDILQERYAAGEIERDEYEKKKSSLDNRG